MFIITCVIIQYRIQPKYFIKKQKMIFYRKMCKKNRMKFNTNTSSRLK